MATRVQENIFKPATPSATRYSGIMPREDESFAPQIDLNKIAQGVQMILAGLGEQVEREGLLETPSRVARMYQELLYGNGIDPASEITCTFNENTDELIMVRDIAFSSICEHHLVPFVGLAHVGYIPDGGRITGLSKLARVVELASKRLQVQERMTVQIADALMRKLEPVGVAVIVEAEHFCMSLRGVHKPGAKTVTSALRGVFKENQAARAEIFSLMRRQQG